MDINDGSLSPRNVSILYPPVIFAASIKKIDGILAIAATIDNVSILF